MKSLIMILLILIGGSLFLLNSYKKETTLKPRTKNYSKQIKIFTEKADVLYDAVKLDSALYYYNKALSLSTPDIDYVNYVYLISAVGDIQLNTGNFTESEATLTKALPYLKKIKEPIYARNIYSFIGLNYYSTYDFKNALFYHKKALKLPGPPYKKVIVLLDISLVYVEQKKYQEAVNLLTPLSAKKIVFKKYPMGSDVGYAQLLDRLGFCYFNLGDQRTLSTYNKSLELNLKLKNEFGLAKNYQHLCLFYQKSNSELAQEYAKKSYKYACKVYSLTERINSLQLIIKTSGGNDLKPYSFKYIKLIDSITEAKQKSKKEFTNIKYNFNKDKQENFELKSQKAENELQIEKQKSRNLISSVIIIFALGIIIFLYSYLTTKARKEKNEAIYKSEMQISRKLHDELANDVYQTFTLAQNRDLELTENKNLLLNNLQVIYSRARNISKENSTIITNENYSIALKEMISEFNDPNINFILNGLETISWNEIEKNKKITVYRVLQELLVNTKKHSDASLIGITFKKTDKSVTVSYTDNGKGFDLNSVTFRNGLQNIENRILAIKGEINIDSQPSKGFKVFFKFPL